MYSKGKEIPNFEFYVAFAFFRLCGIAQGVYKRSLQGNASAQNAKQVGKLASLLATSGWATVSKKSHQQSKL